MGFFAAQSAFRRFLRLALAVSILAGGACTVLRLRYRSSAPKLLEHALALADLNNWSDAEPEFRSAAEVFRAQGDHRGEMYAQWGMIRSTAEHRKLTDTVAES